ncbi:MAG: class II fructose-bisphosphate aldolase [Bacillota bacterium]
MPLCNPEKMLNLARSQRFGVGSFNIFNMESAKAIVAAAEAERAPVMLQIWSGFENGPGIDTLGAIAIAEAKKASVPVAVHLDHGATLAQVGAALFSGFTSVMLDGSSLPLEQNIFASRQVVEICRSLPVTVEGEIGHVGGGEAGTGGDATALTDPEEALRYYEESGVDFVAVSIGTAHGNYDNPPTLDIGLLQRIAAKLPCPLVLHGSSYTPEDMLAEAVRNGISKVNVATELGDTLIRATVAQAANLAGVKYANELTDGPYAAMSELVRHKIRLFGGTGKAELL